MEIVEYTAYDEFGNPMTVREFGSTLSAATNAILGQNVAAELAQDDGRVTFGNSGDHKGDWGRHASFKPDPENYTQNQTIFINNPTCNAEAMGLIDCGGGLYVDNSGNMYDSSGERIGGI